MKNVLFKKAVILYFIYADDINDVKFYKTVYTMMITCNDGAIFMLMKIM